AAPWARIEEKGDPRLIPHFIYKKDKPRARLGLKHHAEWMQSMESTFGPYSWEKYCVVQVPTRWGGMENAGNTWIMERLFDGRDRGVGTLAHEFVHMWFGNAAGYGEWYEAWLSEGFATYFGPWLHAQVGGPPLRRSMEGSRRRWRSSSCSDIRPIRWKEFEAPDDFFSSSAPNTYQKAAWVLHMLRGELGDGAFFEGISNYYASISPGIATTPQFIEAMEASSGRKLGWFFEQWLDRPGCPQLSIRWEGESVFVEQLQEDLFRFRLPLQWTNGEGKRQKQVFEVRQRTHKFSLGSKVSAPAVDPDVELLYR
ncbi:MAG: M1 family aminopeptidase, partial [Planctomycetota bacterium]|nr:M1 family aminopeptidase [Planctomycetota bacterium]